MNWQFSVFLIVMVFSAIAAVLLAMMVWKQRILRGGMALFLMMLAVAEWCVTQIAELMSLDLYAKVWFSKFSYIGIGSVPVLLFLFTLRFVRKDGWLKKSQIVYLWLVPVMTFLLVLTNEWHKLVWSDFTVRILSGRMSVIYGHGVWFWVIATYIYILSLVSAFLLLQVAYQIAGHNRLKTFFLILAAILPVLANVLYLLGPGQMDVMDFTPVAFTITGLILVTVLYGYRPLDYKMVLRNLLVENLSDGFILIDEDGRLLDINPIAKKLIGVQARHIEGRCLVELIQDHVILSSFEALVSGQEFMLVNTVEGKTWLLAKMNIPDIQGVSIAGSFFILRDITFERRIESEAQNDREIFTGIFDQFPLMIGYLDRNMRFLTVNRTYANWYHLTVEEIVGKSISQIITDIDVWNQVEKRCQEVLEGKEVTFEMTMYRAGENRILDVRLVPHFDELKKVKAFFSLVQDITERKTNEAEEIRDRKLADALLYSGIALHSSLELEPVLQNALVYIEQMVDSEMVCILTLQDDRLQLVASSGCNEPDLRVGRFFSLEDRVAEKLVISEKKIINVTDVQREYPSWIKPPFTKIHSWLGVPMIYNQSVVGMLSLGSAQTGHFSKEDENNAARFADQVAIAFENARAYQKMKQLATVDMLTGLYNRRQLYTLGESEFERSLRYNKAMSLIILDMDDFKTVNDRYGHKTGDEVFQIIARRCLHVKRRADMIGRYGGDEFVVILPETDIEQAVQAAERLRKAISETKIPYAKDEFIHVTASLGVAQRSEHTTTFEDMLDLADRALYVAKRSGRNRVKEFDESLLEIT